MNVKDAKGSTVFALKSHKQIYLFIYFWMMHRVLRGSQDSKAPGGQWDQEDMRVHMGRKVEEEQKEHKAQQDPEGSVWVFTPADPAYLF